MNLSFAELYERYRTNVTPEMVDVLAGQLHVGRDSLLGLGIGWKPNENAWIFPERDADGEIIGLVKRYWDGHKCCVKGSKRGLTYAAVQVTEGYVAARQQWQRVTADDPCPICGRSKWCGVDGNVDPPRFVRCMGEPDGAVYGPDKLGAYIHELIPGTFRKPARFTTPLAETDTPVLVVEGQSDCAAGMDLGFVVVGRPSAQGGSAMLAELLKGRSAAIIGEHDSGAGKTGMEQMFQALQAGCPAVTKLMPPAGIKDLRDWVRHGLTSDQLLQAIGGGDTEGDPDILEERSPLYVARQWLNSQLWADSPVHTIRHYKGEWFRWAGGSYRSMTGDHHREAVLRSELYQWLADKKCRDISGGKVVIQPYKPDKHRLSDIIDALLAYCLVGRTAPCWLDRKDAFDAASTLIFQNGILRFTDYIRNPAAVILQPTTPALFSTTIFPYAYDGTAECPLWHKFLNEIFDKDIERVKSLQEWFGYNMVADTTHEKFMLFVGRPASGKSTVLSTLQAVLGPSQYAISTFQDLCSEFGLSSLLGVKAILMPDAHVVAQNGAARALERIKNITGRDGTNVNRKNLSYLQRVQIGGRITIACNDLPELVDSAEAINRRMLLLHFPCSFEDKADPTLKDRLATEAVGIARWSLEGLRRLRKQGEFQEPKSSQEMRAEFRTSVSPLREFVEECCTLDRGWVYQHELYDVFKRWSKDHQVFTSRLGHNRFSRRLRNIFPALTRGQRSRGRVDNTRGTTYEGMELRTSAKQRYLL